MPTTDYIPQALSIPTGREQTDPAEGDPPPVPGPVPGDPPPVPTPEPDPTLPPFVPPVSTSTGVPAWLAMGVGLFIVGGTAELLYKINPNAGYGFALIVVLGFAASGGRIGQVQQFMAEIGAIAS